MLQIARPSTSSCLHLGPYCCRARLVLAAGPRCPASPPCAPTLPLFPRAPAAPLLRSRVLRPCLRVLRARPRPRRPTRTSHPTGAAGSRGSARSCSPTTTRRRRFTVGEGQSPIPALIPCWYSLIFGIVLELFFSSTHICTQFIQVTTFLHLTPLIT